MLDLPEATAIKKMIPKTKVFEHFAATLSPRRRRAFDAEISRLTLVHEISSHSLNFKEGKQVSAIFVMLINLRTKNFSARSIETAARLFKQKLLMVLEADGCYRLAIDQNGLVMGDWTNLEDLHVTLDGLDLDQVWRSLVEQVAGIHTVPGRTLDEELVLEAQKKKLEKEIGQMEKKVYNEKQFNRQVELNAVLKELRKKRDALI